MNDLVIIPYNQLSSDSLHGLIEEFITREGTDYGETESPLQHKMDQILNQLKNGKAVITYDADTQTSNIILKEQCRVQEHSYN
ncbi:MAG: YheU family protein [Desulfobacterales bacterium]|nr:YheU family protein [Desulfobacterales bacterium]